MKNIFLIVVLLLFSISCNSQKGYVKNDINCKFNNIITEQEKKINVEKYNSMLSLQGNLTLINNDNLLSEIWKLSDGEYSNKQTNKQTHIGKWLMYFNNGKLKSADFKYEKGFEPIGIETHYDQNGNITKTIDHRQADKYPICFKEAIAIVEKKKGRRDSIFSIGKDSILHNKKRYYWSIYVKEPNPKNSNREGKSWAFRIDAVTGKLIKKVPVETSLG